MRDLRAEHTTGRSECWLLLAVAVAVAGVAVACAGPGAREPDGSAVVASDAAPIAAEPIELGDGPTFLAPNIELAGGVRGHMHVTEEDMPLVVAIGLPRSPPKFGSSRDARRVAIESMQLWERALQPHLPWFRLEFVEKSPTAGVQVQWKRKITGPWGGFGGQRWGYRDGVLWVGGAMEVSTTPSNYYTLELDDVRDLIAHEFGHVLGLGHCLACDSAMNYADATESSVGVRVKPIDIRTFLALVEQPNALPRRAPTPATAP